jgi:hypothetical protein
MKRIGINLFSGYYIGYYDINNLRRAREEQIRKLYFGDICIFNFVGDDMLERFRKLLFVDGQSIDFSDWCKNRYGIINKFENREFICNDLNLR